jgi:hypothetical protein
LTGFFFPEVSPQYYVAIGVAGRGSVTLYGDEDRDGSEADEEIRNDIDSCCESDCESCCDGDDACIAGCENCDREGSKDVLMAVWRTGGSTTPSSVFCDPSKRLAQRRFGAISGTDQLVTYEQRDSRRLEINIDTPQGFEIDDREVCEDGRGQAWLTFDLSRSNRLMVREVGDGGCGEINETAIVDLIARGDDVVALAGHTSFDLGLPTVFDNDGDAIVGFASGTTSDVETDLSTGFQPPPVGCTPGQQVRGRRRNPILCPPESDLGLPDNSHWIVVLERDSNDLAWAKLLATRSRDVVAVDPIFSLSSEPAGLVIDAEGDLLLLGTFRNNIELGPGPLCSNGSNDIYLAKYSPRGELLAKRILGGAYDDIAGWSCPEPPDEDGECLALVPPALSIDPNDGSVIVRGNAGSQFFTSDGVNVPGGDFELRLPPEVSDQACTFINSCLTVSNQTEAGCFAP